MKITVLDGYAENPGDLSWEWLKKYGEPTIYDRTPEELICERTANSEILITNKTPLTRETLKKTKNLKYVGLLSTGYNVVDWTYCKKAGIPVCNIPTYSTEAVAQNVFAHILEYTNQVAVHSASVYKGEWSSGPDFSYHITQIYELKDKTIGIIGFGKIGKAVADIAEAFKMNVLAYTNHPYPYKNTIFTDLDSLLKESDFVTIHCPLTPQTEGLADKEFFNKMKKSAMFINTSRGPVVNEKDLTFALNNGIIAAAGLDVLSKEPPAPDNPILSAKNCTITPHIAWAGFETRKRLMEIAEENINAFLSGNTINCVY